MRRILAQKGCSHETIIGSTTLLAAQKRYFAGRGRALLVAVATALPVPRPGRAEFTFRWWHLSTQPAAQSAQAHVALHAILQPGCRQIAGGGRAQWGWRVG